MIVVADDLTGAADCQLRLAPRYTSLTRLKSLSRARLRADLTRVDAVVLDSEARSAESPEASERALARCLAPIPRGHLVYLKMDSTLRGAVGRQVATAAETLTEGCIPVALANPREGRQTNDGIQLVDGLRVDRTAFACDPTHPIADARVASLFRDSGLCVEEIPLTVVRGPLEALARRLTTGPRRVAVLDALEIDDLRRIGQAVVVTRLPVVCGSAGLVEHLDLGPSVGTPPPTPDPARTMLVVSGSLHPVARRQLDVLEEAWQTAAIEAASGAGADVVTSLRRHGRAVIASSTVRAGDGDPCRMLARIVAAAAGEEPVDALVLVGGRTAHAVCDGLGIDAFEFAGSLFGLPLCRTLERPPRSLVLKPGGFGSTNALVDAADALQPRPQLSMRRTNST